MHMECYHSDGGGQYATICPNEEPKYLDNNDDGIAEDVLKYITKLDQDETIYIFTEDGPPLLMIRRILMALKIEDD